MPPTVRPYGAWQSPITAERIAAGMRTISEIQVSGAEVFWLEMRPTEGGRSVVMRRRADGAIEDCLPPGYSARTRVHEYGGGAFLVAEGQLFFSNFADQRLHRLPLDGHGPPQPLTPPGYRYADGVWDARRRRIICVREDHARGGEPANAIVAVDADGGGAGEVLLGVRDFYAAPRLSPDGARLAWLAWDHPAMPWDAAEVWVATVQPDGRLCDQRHVAGGRGLSAVEPSFSPDGVLHVALDPAGWWNLYRWNGGLTPVAPMEAECAGPLWVFGLSHYAFAGPERLACAYSSGGRWHLAVLEAGRLLPVDGPWTEIGAVHSAGGRVVFLGASPAEARAVVALDPVTRQTRTLFRPESLAVPEGYLSLPQAIEFPTQGDRNAYGLFYPPRNEDFAGPRDERPPLVVMIHGGPTSAASPALRPGIQFYTSRGLAVLDVNYGGSTGYGRAYRERLYGQWGIVDVDDCVSGAAWLADRGLVDRARLAITGGSAGGYTALACLTFRRLFAAGASHYGVSDCERLAQETHKFEARYLDQLIGPYPERRDLYVARSPLHHLERLDRPVIFFQGLDDRVVPPNQSERMFEGLRRKGIPTAYVTFEGEQHGFRKAETIRRALEGELYFFSRIFGFTPADPIPPVPIENL
ncbi:MAG: prolyl oligopeptidase family serine peptidase [Candidatus Methylomirabilales bacterium]